jgi:hypothetical protein
MLNALRILFLCYDRYNNYRFKILRVSLFRENSLENKSLAHATHLFIKCVISSMSISINTNNEIPVGVLPEFSPLLVARYLLDDELPR